MKPTLLHRSLSLLFVLGLSTACATGPVQLKPLSFDNGDWSGTAALLSYSIETDSPAILKSGCTLTLQGVTERPESGLTYNIDLDANAHFTLFEAPPGQYEGKTLKCADGSKWELTEFLKGKFPLVSGKINFLGKALFRFNSGDKNLAVIQETQKPTTAALAENLKKLPPGWRLAIFDPFTRKPITQDMLVIQESYHLNVHSGVTRKRGHEATFNTDGLVAALGACDLDEQNRFPYRIGTVLTTATYKNGELQDLTENGRNSFSNEFNHCVETELRAFNTKAEPSVTIKLTL